ncbi:MAG TPA: DUF58 domain-containing protein, partial [Spirochaetota bacterium]|nr:DUF58 domain-containing protein [Spirochaetota bacterium]
MLKFFASSALFIFVFIFVYYVVIFFRYKNTVLEFFTIGDGVIHPLKKTTLEIECKNLIPLFPGFFSLISFNLFEQGKIIKKYTSLTSEIAKNKIRIDVIFDRHGKFELKDFSFLIKDFFGLSIYEIKINFTHQLNVMPYFLNEIEIPIFTSEGGERIIQSIKKINSQDFFDNRKYYPGDDFRRINWKVFAHSNELHIRQEEKIPPKVGEIFLIFLPYSLINIEYEYICSIFLSTVYFLLKNNYSVKVLTPQNKVMTIDDEKDIYEIINSSYTPFSDAVDLKEKIVFCSFYQLQMIVSNSKTKDTFFAASFYNVPINNNEVLESV